MFIGQITGELIVTSVDKEFWWKWDIVVHWPELSCECDSPWQFSRIDFRASVIVAITRNVERYFSGDLTLPKGFKKRDSVGLC